MLNRGDIKKPWKSIQKKQRHRDKDFALLAISRICYEMGIYGISAKLIFTILSYSFTYLLLYIKNNSILKTISKCCLINN